MSLGPRTRLSICLPVSSVQSLQKEKNNPPMYLSEHNDCHSEIYLHRCLLYMVMILTDVLSFRIIRFIHKNTIYGVCCLPDSVLGLGTHEYSEPQWLHVCPVRASSTYNGQILNKRGTGDTAESGSAMGCPQPWPEKPLCAVGEVNAEAHT